MNKMILVDFDGTITKEDTCYGMMKKFAVKDWTDIDKKWIGGEMTTRECSLALFDIMDINEEKLRNFLMTLDIDEGFIDFVEFCEENGDSITIISDGYDFNIQTILSRYGLEGLTFYSNSLKFDEKGNYQLDFPNQWTQCELCGTCKIDIYNQLRKEGDLLVYVGDGYSDRCMAEKADLLFAKDYLAKYCDDKGISYIPYENFNDIIKYLMEEES